MANTISVSISENDVDVILNMMFKQGGIEAEAQEIISEDESVFGKDYSWWKERVGTQVEVDELE